MMQFLIAAPSSGSGKTTVTCAVLAALKRRGAAPCAFKTGPDYIDPMFHRSALGVESHNLDLFLSTKDTVQALYARYAAGHGAAVCEGAMGFYDGQGLTTRASAWELADTLGLPVLLVVQPKGVSVTLAAQIQGLVHFRKNSHLAGILLNNCSEKLYNMLKPLLEAETGLPVLGYLPHLPEAVVESRHLGLKTADEIVGLQEKIALLADSLVLDWDKLAELTDRGVRVVFFTGNHDMWVGDYLARECGLEIHTSPEVMTLSGKKVFIAHGDNMKIDGQPMLKFLNRIFRSRTLRWLFSWGVHPDWALRFGHWWSGRSRKGHGEEAARGASLTEPYTGSSEPHTEPLVEYAREYSRTHAVDLFVFGHMHFPRDCREGRLHVVNLGCWAENPSYAVLDAAGELTLKMPGKTSV